MFNPKDKSQMQKLSQAMGYSWEQLQPFRDTRRKLLKNYAGKHYGNSTSEKMPVNLMELAANIYLQRLVASSPAIKIGPKRGMVQLNEICDRFEIAGNQLLSEIDLETTLSGGVFAAIFSAGIVKVGLNATQVEVGGFLHDSGQPFANTVSLDNWIHDMTADTFEQCQYFGDRYTITEDEAKVMFDAKGFKKLIPDADTTPETTAHDMSESNPAKREEFRTTYKVWDVWLPKQNLVLICADSGDKNEPVGEVLKVIEWAGPKIGPYHLLGFSFIDDNTMPLSPASLWEDLNELANRLFRKLGRQAERQKTVGLVQAGEGTTAAKITEANDGEWVEVSNPAAASEHKFGGIAPESLGFLVHVKDLFSYLAGNLDALGGLGPQSDTLGQDQLLGASASQRIQKMQKATYKWTLEIVESLLYWLWTDPWIDMPLVKRVPMLEGIGATASFGPNDRKGDFLDYNITIEPYSMQHQSPESKLMALKNIMDGFIGPLMPLMQAQGATINVQELFKQISSMANLPELNNILMYADPQEASEPIGEMPMKASQTKRTYERINRPGATRQGKDQILQQAMFGGKPQTSEAASLSRPTG